MQRFDQRFLQDMKQRLELELLGVAQLGESTAVKVKQDAETLLPGATAVIVLGKEIYQEVVSLLKPSKEAGEAEAGALLNPHYTYLNGRLTKAIYDMAKLFRNQGFRALPLPPSGIPTDQRTLVSIFSYKHAAVSAGLGTIGRSGLLITRKFGPRVRLCALLTDAPLEQSPVPQESYCKDCHACIRVCPAHALETPNDGEFYSINKFACRSYRGVGFTCSMCMKVCQSGQN
ncbi:MAG: epoxyqueuosine reductase [Deltaproteobacteria bacterium]|nr:epoxyqueuosine reductase [Deltaproteobacteria bacterium]MBW1961100.1 epoxyqueuosine reductase [Deltaproteobacteria bacterium]MBW1995367.1 epoxyqueuosine reductase [Deltaproteobacteria bacterium]MBW2150482.1 epoxyqueuosine reductase [Deltaproteobacteria bacterium]